MVCLGCLGTCIERRCGLPACKKDINHVYMCPQAYVRECSYEFLSNILVSLAASMLCYAMLSHYQHIICSQNSY